MFDRAPLRLVGLLPVLFTLACTEAPPTLDAGDGDETLADESGDASADASGDGDGDALRPNWHEDIAPLVYGNCVGCHFEGGIAPFSLESHEQAAPFAALIDDAVSDGLMPPWGALETEECEPEHSWLDDRRLSDAQKQLFADWLAAGAPEGDPADAAPLPTPPSLELPETSVVLQNPAPFAVDGTDDSFICMAVDPGNTQDVWVTGVQMIPDNTKIVHHVLTYIDTEATSDSMVDQNGMFPCLGFVSFAGATQISTWVPGAVPTETPEGIGFAMPAGSRVVMAYHYHPTGAGEEIDQSSIALRWTEDEPPLEAFMGVFGAFFPNPGGLQPGPNDPGGVPVFEIPPNVPDHTETIVMQIPDALPPLEVFTIGTHMHYVGVDMKISVERDGQQACVIQTPRWDFNWQRNYDIDAPIGALPTIQGGDIVTLRCTYDNTLDNPSLVAALTQQGLSEPISVGVGEQSLDEMCVTLVGIASALPLDQLF